jgi:hypothetical protein
VANRKQLQFTHGLPARWAYASGGAFNYPSGTPRMDHRQRQCRIAFLFSNREQDADLAILDLEHGFVGIAARRSPSRSVRELAARSGLTD